MITLATSPVIHEKGLAPRRIVLRVHDFNGSKEFIIHHENLKEDGSHESYYWGCYYRPDNKGAAAVMATYLEAMKCFHGKSMELIAGTDYSACFPAWSVGHPRKE